MPEDQSNAVKQPDSQPRQQQIDLENWCRNIGADRALAPGWEKGAANCLADRVVAIYLKKVREIYRKSRHSPGRQQHIWDLMHSERAVDHVAVESLVYVLSRIDGDMSANQLGLTLGKRAEYVLWLTHPSWGRSQHLRGLKLASNNDLGMGLMLKRLRDQGFRKAASYQPLKQVERAALGRFFIECIAESTKLIETFIQVRQMRKKRMVRPTALYWEFQSRWKQALKLFRPLRLPMLVPPKPWTGHSDGGYLTMATSVSTVDWERWPEVSKRMLPCVLGSINLLQSVPHVLDHQQMAVAQALWNLGHPVGGLPKRERLEEPVDQWYKEQGLGPSAYWKAVWQWKSDQRKDPARSSFIHAAIAYEKLKGAEVLHWVWSMDHRGRLYAKGAQLNPQNGDHFRSMVQFQEQSPIKGHEKQFAWSIGDAYGIQQDWAKRQEYLSRLSVVIGRCGEDPLGNLAYIQSAKEPFRFLQLCRDWHGYLNDPGYTSGTIHWLDQTCSGWGHVACLTGDAVLAQYTNVTGHAPADLYMGLGRLVESRIKWLAEQDETDPKVTQCLVWWREHEIPRSLWKKVLMPVIYGRSYQSLAETISFYLRDEISDFLNEQGIRVLDLARVLASTTNNVLKEALPNVRDLSRWLAKLSSMQIDAGLRPYWFTPNGLAVECYSTDTMYDRIELNLAGRKIAISLREAKAQLPNKAKTAKKLVPDYIHSHDAAFLQRFVSHWGSYKHPISCVHDCFGTTLEHGSTMRKELNDQWHRFYSVDYLTRHQGMVQALLGKEVPAPPIVGTLDRNKVGENPHLFS